VKERFEGQNITDVFGCLENHCQEIAEGLKDGIIEIFNVLKEIVKPLKNKAIESVFFISR